MELRQVEDPVKEEKVMRHLLVYLVAVVAAVGLALAGCSQAAPAPTPTKAPSAPGKAAEPTKAAEPAKAAEPTKAPTAAAPKITYPEPGKAITVIVPWDPGSGADVIARLLAVPLEKDLGVPIQVINKPGGGTQIGLTELARAKPDGYTIGMTNQTTTVLTYVDPDRKAAYSRKDFAPIANVGWDTTVIAVKADSPYKDMKDLVAAAKAKPGGISVGDSGMMTSPHFDALLLAKAADVKFSHVHFTGGATAMTALLGGHVDATCQGLGTMASHFKSGAARVLGIMAEEPSRFAPGVKTMKEQGYDVVAGSTRSFSAPAGTPKEIIDRLATSMKRAMDSDDLKKKMDDTLLEQRYMSPEQFAAYWEKAEKDIMGVIHLAREK